MDRYKIIIEYFDDSESIEIIEMSTDILFKTLNEELSYGLEIYDSAKITIEKE